MVIDSKGNNVLYHCCYISEISVHITYIFSSNTKLWSQTEHIHLTLKITEQQYLTVGHPVESIHLGTKSKVPGSSSLPNKNWMIMIYAPRWYPCADHNGYTVRVTNFASHITDIYT